MKQALSVLSQTEDTIRRYILAMETEVNPSKNYEKSIVLCLRSLTKQTKKSFENITKEDIILFLNSFKKSEPLDPLHQSIGTYNLNAVHLIRFFRWLYSPDMTPTDRPKPDCIRNITQLKRKEKSIYKPSDMWTTDDHLLFLQHCPSKRVRCYHAIARDSSCRPHEILKLKIKDVVFKMVGDKQYAEITVNGKTGQRHIPLIDSIPYLKDHLDDHPFRTNPNSPLICGEGKSFGRPVTVSTLARWYRIYKNEYFPRLLKDPRINPEIKNQIVDLLKKPWNPYIFRHSGLTSKSKILKESVLRQFAGWQPGSNMHLKYVHYFGNESTESILEAYGLTPKSEQVDKLRPKACPNCSEPNKVDSKFCAKCRMVLTYDAFTETLEEKSHKETEVKTQFDRLAAQIAALEAKIK
jgi:integrase